ncbi:MAG: metallophosphoesterase [Deltaproteobacteria bacterium]|nr:metallophosphoesterase [Deltaproteobacteria bacterium]
MKPTLKEFFRKLHQKRGVQWALSALMVLGLPVIGLYMHVIEPRLVAISHLKIPFKRLRGKNPLRIVQISDLHFGPTNNSAGFLKKCIAKINELKPDVIALTGDFFQWDMKYVPALAHLLSTLKSKLGTFAALGNHDYGVCHRNAPPSDPIDHLEIISQFEKKGIRVLHNEKIFLHNGGETFGIVGVGDFWTSHFDPAKAFARPIESPDPFTLLLCHNPDGIEHLDPYTFDIMLSGHVHGGQISFPFIGPLAVPVKNRHWRRGLHKIGEKWLFTSRGLGQIFKARLLSRPEIACLDLVPAES